MKRIKFILLLVGLFVIGSSMGIGDKWVFLGERTVKHTLDRDEIMITAKRGEFTKLKFKVKKAKVDFHKVVVVYGNGERMEVELRDKIPAGGETRAIDLRGRDRVIKKIIFFYDTDSRSGKRAVVRLFGKR